jgi:hypothetical protein
MTQKRIADIEDQLKSLQGNSRGLECCYIGFIPIDKLMLTKPSMIDEEAEEKRQKASKEVDEDDLDSYMEKIDTVKFQRPSKTNLQKELQKLIKVWFIMSAYFVLDIILVVLI